MRIYFLEDTNLQVLNDHFKSLYIITIDKFKERLEVYKKRYLLNNDSDYTILINELEETLDILNDSSFEFFFLGLGTEILEKVRYASVSKHTDKCVIRAVFDIIFKYCVDFEFKISHLCCDNTTFKLLQIEILRDLRWKIKIQIIQSPIQSQNLSLSPKI